MKRLNGAEREGKQNYVNAMFSSTDKICQVPMKDGRTIQRNVDGTVMTFHKAQAGARLKAQFDTSAETSSQIPRSRDTTRSYPWHSSFAPNSGDLTGSTTSSNAFTPGGGGDEQLVLERELYHRKLHMTTGKTPVAHLRNLQQSLDKRYDSGVSSHGEAKDRKSTLHRSESADSLCGRGAHDANGFLAQKEQIGNRNSCDSNPPSVHASPWLDEHPTNQPSGPFAAFAVQRNSNLRGAGHLRTMAPAITPKPAPHARMGPPSFEWTSTGASMEAYGETSHGQGREAVQRAAAISNAEASATAKEEGGGGEESGGQADVLLNGLALPVSTSERCHTLTKLAAQAHLNDGVPVTASYRRMDVALPSADKALNPFGRPLSQQQQGFLAPSPRSADAFALNLQQARASAAVGQELGSTFVAAVTSSSSPSSGAKQTASRAVVTPCMPPAAAASSSHFSISLRPGTSAAAIPSGWPIGGYYATSNQPPAPSSTRPGTSTSVQQQPSPISSRIRPHTSASARSQGGSGGGGGAEVVPSRGQVSRDAARSLSSMGLGRPATALVAAATTTTNTNNNSNAHSNKTTKKLQEEAASHFLPPALGSRVGVGGTQQQLEDRRFEERMHFLASASAQHQANSTSPPQTKARPSTGGNAGTLTKKGAVGRGRSESRERTAGGGGNGGGGGGGFHLSQKLAPRDTHNRVFDPSKESGSTRDAEAAASAVADAVDPSFAAPRAPVSEACMWGELTSVLDNFMHPSNNPNRKYPTPTWAPTYVHTRKAFKLRV